MTDSRPDIEGRPPIWRAALFGLCPSCDAPTLFDGPVHFVERCGACQTDLSKQNVGDGPAAFLTMIIGALVIVLAMLVEIYIHPPFWLHVIIWVPFTVLAVVGGLRFAKGALFHAEWRKRAHEGRLADD
jgi:uncharacterized protein (DUF983 family)